MMMMIVKKTTINIYIFICCKAPRTIGHFRVPLCLCLESKYETILMKMTFICMKKKLRAELIFI